jgi:acyl-CoA thioester hydrolase
MMSPEAGTFLDGGWYECRVRVQYPQCDPQGVVHHAVYLLFFEHARTEMLRALGLPYARLEAEGTRFMVVESRLRHRAPARYDDVLRVRARTAEVGRVRIRLEYLVLRDGEEGILCEGETLLASTDAGGRLKALPAGFREAVTLAP